MIEWSRVKELQGEVGADDFGEVVELFLEEVEEVITRLETKPSCDNLEQDLHFLKGSALSLGFLGFSRLCHDGEQKSAAGHAETVDIGAIISEFRVSKDDFLAHLDEKLG